MSLTRPQSLVVQKIAGYFKVPKDKLRAEYAEDSGELIHSPTLSEMGFSYHLYCIETGIVSFNSLLEYKKLVKTKMFDQFMHGYNLMDPRQVHNYMLGMYAGGIGWFLYRTRYYEGIGGWYIKDTEAGGGYCLEPINNFLAGKFPREE